MLGHLDIKFNWNLNTSKRCLIAELHRYLCYSSQSLLIPLCMSTTRDGQPNDFVWFF